jgi:hypothetical protein
LPGARLRRSDRLARPAAIRADSSIGSALNAARAAVRVLPSADWANYLHYGSYDFTLRTNLSALVRFTCIRSTNIFATWQTNAVPY